MNTAAARLGAIVVASMMLSSCALGYNTVLFMTKSNVGVDIDTTPPTAEVSIARREGVIGPTFEVGKKPPVLASFRSDVRGVLGLFYSVSSTFAGGDAAATMTKLFDAPDAKQAEDATLCLTQKPSPRLLGHDIAFPGPGDVRPFLFGTDTSFGLKIAWSGLTAQFPDTVRLGYNRKEFALAPVFGSAETCGADGRYKVNVPSFLATVDSSATAKSLQSSGIEHLQYFATGIAATNLALRREVRKAMLKRLDPEAAAEKFKSFEQNQDLQIGSVGRIQAAFKESSGDRKNRILQEAKNLTLVPPDTTAEKFGERLSDAVEPNDSALTQKLDALEKFIKGGR